jgi:aminoglycoside phosphotransferase (APT) family kinase protein
VVFHRSCRTPAAGLTLRKGVGGVADGIIGPSTWLPGDLYRAAMAQGNSASGYYNRNVKLTASGRPVIVRIPIRGSDEMDLAIWPEPSVLRAIRDSVTRAPRLLYANQHPRFQILEFIGGEVLDRLAPAGEPVPGGVIEDLAETFSQLCETPRERIPPLPEDWPADGETASFGRRLSAVTEGIYARFRPDLGELFASLGIPSDPLALVASGWTTLRPRPFRLLHCDIHRKNLILSGRRTYLLDWELALWGDPVYDLAVHLHKMGYQPAEYEAMQAAWLAAVPAALSEGWEPDLHTYLVHERVKSAIVDTVRYTKVIASGRVSAHDEAARVGKLAQALGAARTTGGPWPDTEPPGPADIAAHIRNWAHRQLAVTLRQEASGQPATGSAGGPGVMPVP